MTKDDTEALKAFLNRGVSKARTARDRVVVECPKRIVFVGTCGDGSYLQDPESNRRYWPKEEE